ncbi:MAG: PLD nuclease N-terminal domain-containing protein [Bacillota bacterium]
MDTQQLMMIILPLAAIQLILMIIALIDLVRREPERVKGPKWAWALACIFIGTFGPIAYFLFGRRD